MKHLKFLLLTVFMTGITSYGQTAESVLSKYIEVTGGQVNWEKVSSLKVTGTAKLISQGMELPFTRVMEEDGKQKTSLKINGMDYVATAFDGSKVWGSNQQMQPALKSADEIENTKRLISDFPFPGFNWKERGYKAELVGQEVLNEIKTYKVKLTKTPQMSNGEEVENISYIYIDTKEYFPILRETLVISGPYKGQRMKSYLSDYRNIDGLMYPFVVTMKYDDETFQILESEIVEWNVEIDATIYEFPGS